MDLYFFRHYNTENEYYKYYYYFFNYIHCNLGWKSHENKVTLKRILMSQ